MKTITRTECYATSILPKIRARYVMKVGRFVASLMRAQRLVGEGVHALPPGEAVPVYPIDVLPGCPEAWVRGKGSYVCPVAPDWGLWFDWTGNDQLNTAVLPSVKGMNPITGRKIEGLSLEKFVEKCPIHGEPFKGDELFCEKCNFKWPPQNYVSSPNTLWFDGFRQPDGSVRQFFFTEDDERDIASAVIGKQNVVPAFGFAFFEPKKRREPPPVAQYRNFGGTLGLMGVSYSDGTKGMTKGLVSKHCEANWVYHKTTHTGGNVNYCSAPTASGGSAAASETEVKTSGQVMNFVEPQDASPKGKKRSVLRAQSLKHPEFYSPIHVAQDWQVPHMPVKDVAVGAGARIRQDLAVDPLPLTEWRETPEAIMRLYFVFEGQFKQIVEKGVNDLEGSEEGYLKGLPVG